MSLWERAQELPHDTLEQVRSIYGDGFPIEVRHYLANWLEQKIWAHETEEQKRTFVEELVMEIQKEAEMLSPENFLAKMKLNDAAKAFSQHYSHSPGVLYDYLKKCMSHEMMVLNAAPFGAPAQNESEVKYGELINGIRAVRQSVAMAGNEIRDLQAHQENFSLQYHNCLKHKAHLEHLTQQPTTDLRELAACLRIQIDNLEMTLNSEVTQIKQQQLILVERLKQNIQTISGLQVTVIDRELMRWKREQQLHGNGVRMQTSLDTIQEWCQSLAELIWNTRQQVSNTLCIINQAMQEIRQVQLTDVVLKEILGQATALLSTLVSSTFVIEKQPPQVMKTNTRFTATVRLLVGGQLNVHMTPPKVTVTIISEQQAQNLLKTEPIGPASGVNGVKQPMECGDILNNTGTMEFNATTRQLSVSFRNMQLRKIKRAEKKGTESVMDEKLTLFFQSKFKVGGGELDYQVWTLSLPVVVIVHGNQEPHGWATVTWDNAFSQLTRRPFAVPDKVSWSALAETLCIKFKSATDGHLTEDNLRYLAEKIFKIQAPANSHDLNNTLVSWSAFCKDPLQERSFTFWEWFYMVVKVTRDYLRALWCDGLIMGFIQKGHAEELLSKCPPGTFLLRYSDSELGAITIAWVSDKEVFSIQPFQSRDLMLRSLADRLADLQHLQYLYPNIPKDDVFSKYYSKPESEPQKNGYVKPTLALTLPPVFGMYGHAGGMSPDTQRNTPSVHSSYNTMASGSEEFLGGLYPGPEMMEQIECFDVDAVDGFLNQVMKYPGIQDMDS